MISQDWMVFLFVLISSPMTIMELAFVCAIRITTEYAMYQ